MKFNNFLKLLAIAAVAAVACKKDPGQEEKKLYTPEEAKAYINSVAGEAVDMIEAADFKPVVDFTLNAVETINNSDPSAIEQWAEGVREAIDNTKQSTEKKGGLTIENYFYDVLLTLAPCTGHFNLDKNVWKYTAATDLQFTYKDKNGKDCKFVLSGTAATSDFDLETFKDFVEYESSSYKVIINGTIKIQLPKHIDVSLSENGKEIASVSIDTEVSVNGAPIHNDSPDFKVLKNATASIAGKVNCCGYTLTLDKVSLKDKNLCLNTSLSKGSTRILAESVLASGVDISEVEGSVIPSVDKADVDVDILGKLQVKGNCLVMQCISNIMQMEANADNEATFKKMMNAANSDFNVGMYFGNETLQATAKLEAFQNTSKSWYAEPVLYFPGAPGETYKFDEYFTEASFAGLLKKINNLRNDFINLFPGNLPK